ncbi:MAG: hypothetical protein Q7S86_05380 [bacterium]|nr:hypothetical protein [bacterium]
MITKNEAVEIEQEMQKMAEEQGIRFPSEKLRELEKVSYAPNTSPYFRRPFYLQKADLHRRLRERLSLSLDER